MFMMTPEDLGRMIDAHAAALVLYARQWCGAPEDVVQEAFVKLVARKSQPAQVVPWLYRVVRNAAISAGRAESRRRKHETRRASQTVPWFLPVEGATLDGETVTQALVDLPAEEREVITLHLWGGLSFGQIAEVMGGSASTAHRWYLAGLARLRERLHVSCPNFPPKK